MKWFEEDAQGEPKCSDKMRAPDLLGTTLEHIYPKSADAKEEDASLEEVKHSLGNLTVLRPGENDKLANEPFGSKRMQLAKSTLQLNIEIAEETAWTRALVHARTERLVKIAMKVFTP